jgi:hypothetical protein
LPFAFCVLIFDFLLRLRRVALSAKTTAKNQRPAGSQPSNHSNGTGACDTIAPPWNDFRSGFDTRKPPLMILFRGYPS